MKHPLSLLGLSGFIALLVIATLHMTGCINAEVKQKPAHYENIVTIYSGGKPVVQDVIITEDDSPLWFSETLNTHYTKKDTTVFIYNNCIIKSVPLK